MRNTRNSDRPRTVVVSILLTLYMCNWKWFLSRKARTLNLTGAAPPKPRAQDHDAEH